MANFQGIAAASQSLERFLTRRFADQPPIEGRVTRAVLARTEDFEEGNRPAGSALSIFLYRVDVNKSMRAAWSSVASHEQRVRLPLDLHYLLTPWDANAADEQRIIGRTIQCLEETPSLSGPLLGHSGNWQANEAIQICMEDLSTEDVMRTFDSLPVDYKLSLPYVARIVRIDGPVIDRHEEVTTGESHLSPTSNPAGLIS